MAWDLGRALSRKEEFETSRMLDFEFRLRARTAKNMAAELGLDEAELIGRTVDRDHAQFIAELAAETGRSPQDLERLWTTTETAARRSLISERGDPAPYKLA
jgi:hypothetical protein